MGNFWENCCLIQAGCCCFAFTCFTCLVITAIAISDLIMLIFAIVTYVNYLTYWDVLDRTVVTIPIIFITIMSIRLFLSCCVSTGHKKDVKKGAKKDEEQAQDTQEQEKGENEERAKDTQEQEKGEEEHSPLRSFLNFVSWGLFIAQLIGGIMALQTRHQLDHLELALNHKFHQTAMNETSPVFLQNLQKTMHCCGLSGHQDYTYHTDWPIGLQTNSCCIEPPCYAADMYPTGCTEAIDKAIYFYHTWLGALGIGIPLLVLLVPLSLLLIAIIGCGCLIIAPNNDFCRNLSQQSRPVFKQLYGIDLKPSKYTAPVAQKEGDAQTIEMTEKSPEKTERAENKNEPASP